jgi:hypothetical protein
LSSSSIKSTKTLPSKSKQGPIETVYNFLEERDGLGVLNDNLLDIATKEILADKRVEHRYNSTSKGRKEQYRF